MTQAPKATPPHAQTAPEQQIAVCQPRQVLLP